MNGSSQARIGLLGGTFNPIHMGHLILAQSAIELFDLSRVVFIPSASPPHKPNRALLPAHHRMAMARLAVEGDPRFEASDIEVRRGGVSYTIDTVGEWYAQNRGTEICFIIGADTLPELHLWKDIYSLLALCRFITFGRPGLDVTAIKPEDLRLAPPWPERLLRDTRIGRLIEISSSDLRHRVAEGMSIRYLVPPAVEKYIAEHALYGK